MTINMSGNLLHWSFIVAFAVPPVVAIINQSKWHQHVKVLVFLIVSLLASAGTVYFQGDLTGKRFLDAALIIVAAAAAYYKGLFKPSGVTDTIENATNLSDSPPQ